MTQLLPQFSYTIGVIVFLSVVGIHLTRKNTNCVFFYILQSAAVALLLFVPAFREKDFFLMLAAVLTLSIKAIVAPYFFFRLIKRHELTFSANTYLSLPLTLIVLALLTGLAYQGIFQPLAALAGNNLNAVPLAVATIFVSIFLIINRRGALSQIVGILSLENGIVSLTSFLGVTQLSGLDIAVSFDIGVWVVIAALFLSIIYKQFGTLDVSTMSQLKEE
jgi:hydrogenase-4 membrane subunit HyfE